MSILQIARQLSNQVSPSATAGGEVVTETANMTQTPVTKFAMFLIAHGLWEYTNTVTKDTTLARALIKKVEAIFKPESLKDYGVNPARLKSFTRPGHIKETNWVRDWIREIANDPDVSTEEVSVMRAALLYANNPTDAKRIANMKKLAAKLQLKFADNVAKVMGESKVEDEAPAKIEDLTAQLHQVVKQMTGKAGTKVDTATLNLQKNVAHKATYRYVRKELTNLYDQALVRFLASKGDIAYAHEAYKHMESLGFPLHKIPVFKKKVPLKITVHAGKIQYLTESEKPISASIPAGATKIKFMDTYDEATGTGAYMSYTAPEAVSTTRLYTKDHKVQATKSKFQKATQVTENIDAYLTRWRKDLVSKDIYKKMGATIALMVYETGMRAGTRQKSAASATGVATYGALSLRPRHIRISASSIIFKYAGKKGVAQEHKILLKDKWTKLIAKNLTEFKKDKRGDDLIFSFENERGTIKPMAPNRMTAYLTSTGYTVGLHKIRHAKGTGLVIELLGKYKFKPTQVEQRSLASKQRAAEEFVKTKIIMPVAALLGHKNKDKLAWRTSIGSYINPAPIAAFFEEHGLRKPSWLPNKVEE